MIPFPAKKKVWSVGKDIFYILFIIETLIKLTFLKCMQRKYIISDIYMFILQFYKRFILYSQDIMTCC